MTKNEYLGKLRKLLAGLPEKDVRSSLLFYEEVINDRMNEGMSEEDAVAEIGSPEEAADAIIDETPLTKIAKHKIKSREKKEIPRWLFGLLCATAIIWVPIAFALTVALGAVVLSLFLTIGILALSIGITFAVLVPVGIAVAVLSVCALVGGKGAIALLTLGGGLVCAGIGVPLMMLGVSCVKGAMKLMGKMIFGFKKILLKKRS